MELNYWIIPYLSIIVRKAVRNEYFLTISCSPRSAAQVQPAKVPHHAGVTLALSISFNLSNILVEHISMLINHCSEVWGG